MKLQSKNNENRYNSKALGLKKCAGCAVQPMQQHMWFARIALNAEKIMLHKIRAASTCIHSA